MQFEHRAAQGTPFAVAQQQTAQTGLLDLAERAMDGVLTCSGTCGGGAVTAGTGLCSTGTGMAFGTTTSGTEQYPCQTFFFLDSGQPCSFSQHVHLLVLCICPKPGLLAVLFLLWNWVMHGTDGTRGGSGTCRFCTIGTGAGGEPSSMEHKLCESNIPTGRLEAIIGALICTSSDTAASGASCLGCVTGVTGICILLASGTAVTRCGCGGSTGGLGSAFGKDGGGLRLLGLNSRWSR
eukprot:3741192-Amphidinium_carterae.2